MNRSECLVPPTTGTGTALTDRSECSRSKRQDGLSAIVARGADERNDQAVQRVRKEQEPEDRLDLFATQACPAGDWLRDGSRDAPTHAGERRIADSQGSVVSVHAGRVPRMKLSTKPAAIADVRSRGRADRQLVLYTSPDSSRAIGMMNNTTTNPASRTFFATSQSSQPITVRFTGP
jgi:hypothetical protein